MRKYIAFRRTPVLKVTAFETRAIIVANQPLFVFFTSQSRTLILTSL